MPALFPPWTNSVVRAGLLGFVGLIVGVPLVLMAHVRTPFQRGQAAPLEQPVPFDHRHHVRGEGIDCRYCHSSVERSRYAGIPATALCMNCHGQIWNDSTLLAPVRHAFFSGEPLVWRRVHLLPDHAFFNHAAHVTRGVGCVSCHGRVDQMASVEQVAPLSMGWCIDCHRRPEQHLRPLDRITDMEWRPASAEERAELARSLHVSPPLHCSGCHR